MKKIFAILLVLAVVAGSVFADAAVNVGNHRLTVTSTVGEILPLFQVTGTLNGSYTVGGTTTTDDATNTGVITGTDFAGGGLASKLSIADADIKGTFVIKQNSSIRVSDSVTTLGYARYKKSLTFEVTVGPMTEQLESGTAATVAGHILTATAGSIGTFTAGDGTGSNGTGATSEQENEITQGDVSLTAGNNTVTFTSAYNGRVNNDQEIGTFTTVWYADASVPNGTYKADVVVAISVNN